MAKSEVIGYSVLFFLTGVTVGLLVGESLIQRADRDTVIKKHSEITNILNDSVLTEKQKRRLILDILKWEGD